MPAQAFLPPQCWVLLKEMQEKMKFTLHPGVRSLSFAACAHANETPGAEDHEINLEAAAVSSFLPYSAVVTHAGPRGSHGSGSKGVAGAVLWLGAAPSRSEAPQPEPCSSPFVVQASGDTAARPQIRFPHMKVKNGRSLVSLSAIPTATNKPVRSRNRRAAKRGRVSFSPREAGREQSTNQTSFSSCFPYEAAQSWPVALATLRSRFLAPYDLFPSQLQTSKHCLSTLISKVRTSPHKVPHTSLRHHRT